MNMRHEWLYDHCKRYFVVGWPNFHIVSTEYVLSVCLFGLSFKKRWITYDM